MKCHLLPIVILSLAVAPGGTSPRAAEVPDNAKLSVTVFPVVITPHNRFPDDLAKRGGIVVATFLEKAGLEDLEVAETMFHPPKTDEIKIIAEAFGKHVGEEPANDRLRSLCRLRPVLHQCPLRARDHLRPVGRLGVARLAELAPPGLRTNRSEIGRRL